MDITHGTVLPAEDSVYRLAGVSKIYRKGGREIPAVIVAIPTVALFQFLQRYIVGGMTAGAVKG